MCFVCVGRGGVGCVWFIHRLLVSGGEGDVDAGVRGGPFIFGTGGGVRFGGAGGEEGTVRSASFY